MLARNTRRILKRSSIPTPSLLQPQLSSAQATKPSIPGEPLAPFFPVGTTQPGQESIPFSGARRKWARPCQAGGEGGFHSHCSHSDSWTMGGGGGGRRRFSVCLTSWSSNNGAFQTPYRSCAFSPPRPPDFSHSFFFLPLRLPPQCLVCWKLRAEGAKPDACHLLPAPTCLAALSAAFLLEYRSHHPQLKSNTSPVPWTPSHNSQSHSHIG